MDLTKLFETQAALDNHIYDKHPELRGLDNLDWKVLALQVELGECANEWRGFKKWSNNQEPRTKTESICGCIMCEHHFIPNKKNPLLEEYVDCLHFILSIGLEMKLIIKNLAVPPIARADITRAFSGLMFGAGTLLNTEAYKEVNYTSVFTRFIQLGELLGFTWEQIEDAYFAKNKVNHERQEANY